MDNKNRFLSGVYHDLYEKKPPANANTGMEPPVPGSRPPESGSIPQLPA